MSLLSGERSLHLTQFGQEVTHGTPVACTAVIPGFSTGIAELDRSPSKINEDYGELAMNEPYRGYYGSRIAKLPFRGDLTFENCMHHFGAAIAGGVTPTLTATGVYLWTYLADLTADTLDSKTIKEGDNLTAYQMSYAMAESLRLSFSTLGAPGNSPWQIDANYIGQDKSPATFDAGAVTPTAPETVMGHLTRLYLGTTSTAWASLTEQVGLLAVDQTIPTGVTPRIYGAGSDVFQFHGRQKPDPTGNWTLFATASTLANLFSPFQTNAGSPVMAEFRARLQALGGQISGTNDGQTITITGSPTGGTFTLTYSTQTTAAIAWNATAAQVQAALWSLPAIGANNVVVTGGPGPATPWVVTFQNQLGDAAVGTITATSSLTGGTAPAIAVTHTATGAGYRKQFTLDTRIRMSAVPVAEDANGATVYRAAVEFVKDATLGGVYQIAVQNGVALLP